MLFNRSELIMHRGYTKRWRKRWDSGYHKDRLLWIMMDYLIDHASHEDKKVYFERYGNIELRRGQILFGRNDLATKLFASPQQIRTRIIILKTIDFLTIETTNKFSIATICNYDLYNPREQKEKPAEHQQINQQSTSNQPQSNELKELKEKYKWLDIPLWLDFRSHRKKLKAPLTERAEKIILDKLDRFSKQNGNKPNSIIEKTIECGWKGVFLPENNETATQTKKPITMKDVENGELERNPAV